LHLIMLVCDRIETIIYLTCYLKFLEENPPPPVTYEISVHREISLGRRDLLLRILGPPPEGVIQTQTSYTTRDGHANRAILYQPSKPPPKGSPLIIMYHGGGYCVGFPEGEEQTCRNLVTTFGAVCLSIAYRLAPEHKYPTGPNDCWDATKWAVANASTLGADPSQGFIIGGTSAGGNITAIIAHKARDENLTPKPTGQYLAIPAICPPHSLPSKYSDLYLSHDQVRTAPILPIEAIDMFMNAYEPNYDDGENFAILNHPRGHADLPPAFFQIDGLDPIRDEGLVYERVLRKEYGIKTRLDVYPGLPHGHWSFFPMLSSAKKFRKEQIEGFGWLLGKEKASMGVEVGEPKMAAV
jgi:acetyl esterase/lipase